MGVVRYRRSNITDAVASSDDGKLRHAAAVKRVCCGRVFMALQPRRRRSSSTVRTYSLFFLNRGKKAPSLTLVSWAWRWVARAWQTTDGRNATAQRPAEFRHGMGAFV